MERLQVPIGPADHTTDITGLIYEYIEILSKGFDIATRDQRSPKIEIDCINSKALVHT